MSTWHRVSVGEAGRGIRAATQLRRHRVTPTGTMGESRCMSHLSRLPLYWRVCLINGMVFVVGTLALAFSPATVSTRVLVSEAVVLSIGLAVILILNALLLRASLAPLDRLIRTMEDVDLQSQGVRLPESGTGTVSTLVRTFNAMLSRLETERNRSNAMALAAQEAERHRIAQELHDEIGQGLTAVLLSLKRAADDAPTGTADELRQVQETVRSTLDEVRHVARRLRPGVLDDLGLLSALAALATEFSTHSGVPVRRGFARGLPQMTQQTELVVYRVAQEALTNTARHARGCTVELSLTKQGDGVALLVADDGRGVHGPEGAGMRGMRERALLVGGELTVSSRPGGGTQVRLVVPDAECGRRRRR
jgi:two-component system, NarL family, sensor histidine kinase UhpB